MSEDKPDRLTTRERRENRRDRRRDWAKGREKKADDAHQASHDAVAMIPLGQPILKGHHSQRRHERDVERSRRSMTQAIEHSKMAEHHNSKADNIEVQLEKSIFDDDPDAIDQLQRRIAVLEESRERIKKYNASCRRGEPDPSILDEAERRDLQTTIQVGFAGPKGQFPSFKLTNLGGKIRADRKRLERLGAERGE